VRLTAARKSGDLVEKDEDDFIQHIRNLADDIQALWRGGLRGQPPGVAPPPTTRPIYGPSRGLRRG